MLSLWADLPAQLVYYSSINSTTKFVRLVPYHSTFKFKVRLQSENQFQNRENYFRYHIFEPCTISISHKRFPSLVTMLAPATSNAIGSGGNRAHPPGVNNYHACLKSLFARHGWALVRTKYPGELNIRAN